VLFRFLAQLLFVEKQFFSLALHRSVAGASTVLRWSLSDHLGDSRHSCVRHPWSLIDPGVGSANVMFRCFDVIELDADTVWSCQTRRRDSAEHMLCS
jgi:hypothetical protein